MNDRIVAMGNFDYLTRGDESNFFCDVKDGHKTIGRLIVSNYREPNCEIIELSVRDPYRNNGIEEMLLASALETVHISSFRIDVCCWVGRAEFYLNHGFIEVVKYANKAVRLSRCRNRPPPTVEEISKVTLRLSRQDLADTREYPNTWKTYP